MLVLRAAVHHDAVLAVGLAAAHLRLHVWAELDVLPEVAHVAADFAVGLYAEGDHGDEAEGEPFPDCC